MLRVRLAPLALLPLALALPAAAQVEPGDVLVCFWQAPLQVMQLRPDGTPVQTYVSSLTDRHVSAAATAGGRVVSSRWDPEDGYTLFDPDGGEAALVTVPEITGWAGDTGVFSNGELALVDQSGRVVVTTEAGQHLRTLEVPFAPHPFGVFIDDEDHVWLTDYEARTVFELDAQGLHLQGLAVGFVPSDLVRAADGTLWVLDHDTGDVHHLAHDGTPLGSFATGATGGQALGIGIEPDGSLLVTARFVTAVYRYDPAGNLLGSLATGLEGAAFLTVVSAFGEAIGTNYCGPAALNSTGQSATIGAVGIDVAGGLPLRLEASAMPPGEAGYFLASQTATFVPFVGGSQGHLCLGGSIGRFTQQVQVVAADGTFALEVDTLAIPQPNGPVAIQPGETWRFQAWFRDQNPFKTSNLTDGLAILFR